MALFDFLRSCPRVRHIGSDIGTVRILTALFSESAGEEAFRVDGKAFQAVLQILPADAQVLCGPGNIAPVLLQSLRDKVGFHGGE